MMDIEQMEAVDRDRRERWLPDADARRVAAAMLAAEPAAEHVIVAMIQPRKTQGVWTTGQPVATVRGAFWLVGPGWYAHGTARNAAAELAEAALANLGVPGTVAYAVIDRDGEVAVFEW
jgi:hypothetical protein